MKVKDLQAIAKDIFGTNVSFHLQVQGGPWWNQRYISNFDEVEPNKVYGVVVDSGNTIDFTINTAKNEDAIIKSFINQYITKWEMKQVHLINGDLRKKTKAECFETFKNNNRVAKYYFYTTLYGIGFFCYFMSPDTFTITYNIVANYLKANRVPFKTEFSEAGWVFRFLIRQDVAIHNELLDSLEI